MAGQHKITILENKRLTDTVISLKLAAEDLAETAGPGRFLHIKCREDSVLRRPVSICDMSDGVMTVVVEVRGDGTRWLAERAAGEVLDVLGPLGRGFDLRYENILIVGGGIGAAPMMLAARAAGAQTAVLGYRAKEQVILTEEFRELCDQVYITTDDGSYGEFGTVLRPMERLLETESFGAVLACGPRPMLKAVAKLAEDWQLPCQVSLEERMGCGVGACLVCACEIKTEGASQMKRVCKDGPVFDAREVVW